MESWIGVKLRAEDAQRIHQAVSDLRRGLISPGEYNEIALQVRSRSITKRSTLSGFRLFISRKSAHFADGFRKEKIYADRKTYSARLDACRGCESFKTIKLYKKRILMCDKCGCFLQAKARLAAANCPDVNTEGKSRWEALI